MSNPPFLSFRRSRSGSTPTRRRPQLLHSPRTEGKDSGTTGDGLGVGRVEEVETGKTFEGGTTGPTGLAGFYFFPPPTRPCQDSHSHPDRSPGTLGRGRGGAGRGAAEEGGLRGVRGSQGRTSLYGWSSAAQDSARRGGSWCGPGPGCGQAPVCGSAFGLAP